MNPERLDWVPYYPDKLLGALALLPVDQKIVYQIVLLRIYDVWGPCRDGLEAMTRLCGINKRRVADALDALFKAGKLERVDGGIMNPFAAEVMAQAEAIRQRHQEAGTRGASSRWKNHKKKQRPPDRPANATAMANDSSLPLPLPKKEDSDSPSGESVAPEAARVGSDEPKSGEVIAPSDVIEDERTRLWRIGLSILKRITGKTDDAARSLIGGWLKITHDDCVMVRRAIEDAEREKVVDPVPWIRAAIGRRNLPRAAVESRNGPAALMVLMEQHRRGGNDEGRRENYVD